MKKKFKEKYDVLKNMIEIFDFFPIICAFLSNSRLFPDFPELPS